MHAQQNLVYNGDFEEYSDCPQGYSSPFQNPKEIEKCVGWKAPTFGTSDYYNTCSSNPQVSVPANDLGFQHPFNGNGYLGGHFANYTGGAGEYGYSGIMWYEYIQGQLIEPLVAGKTYLLTMEVSLAEYSDLMIKEIGSYFSSTPITSPNTASLSVVPQCVFVSDTYFNDTINWIHLESYFVSNGGEKYITIGNFKDNQQTDTLRRYWINPPKMSTYMYVDNVSLTDVTDSVQPPDVQCPNVFTPNGDGANDVWKPLAYGAEGQTIVILNRWGNIVAEGELNNFYWDGTSQKGNLCTEGIYYYKISNTSKTGFIHLIR